jgi:hypothetical protein
MPTLPLTKRMKAGMSRFPNLYFESGNVAKPMKDVPGQKPQRSPKTGAITDGRISAFTK